ncbi:sensor histidine kinase [Actinomadura keratinilytica]
MRRGVSEVFVNLARRSQVLLHKQLTLLDTMERRTEDSEELADLFRLDHLTTRMRRHAEGLVILSGAAPSRQWRRPVQLMDVVRASVAEVEDYERIEVRRLPKIAVTGPAVADLTHLTAELLENATVFSPPHTAVQVHGESVANGFTLEIHDRGLGMAPDVLLDANLRLAETPDFELSDTDRLGLFVVSRLAQRQNIRVSLQKSPYGGTTAVVFIPDALLIETDESGGSTDGRGLSLDTADSGARGPGRPALTRIPTSRTPTRPLLPDGPVELEAPAAPPAWTRRTSPAPCPTTTANRASSGPGGRWPPPPTPATSTSRPTTTRPRRQARRTVTRGRGPGAAAPPPHPQAGQLARPDRRPQPARRARPGPGGERRPRPARRPAREGTRRPAAPGPAGQSRPAVEGGP